MIKIVGESGQYAGMSVPVESELLLGRNAQTCQLVFSSPGISSQHCRLINSDEDVLYVEDLGSTNGTYLASGSRINAYVKTVLRDGEQFYIGSKDNMFRVQVDKTVISNQAKNSPINKNEDIPKEIVQEISSNYVNDDSKNMIKKIAIGIGVAVVVVIIAVLIKKNTEYQQQNAEYQQQNAEYQQQIDEYNNESAVDKTVDAVESWYDLFK